MVNTYDKQQDGGIQLSDNFKVKEFACKCSRCSTILVDTALVEILQKIRDHFGVSVNINSGYRCEPHNTEVGGAVGSHHMKGMAADIRVKGVEPAEVAKYAESIGVRRIGLYDSDHGSFVHIGSAATKNFWKNTSSNKVDTFGGAAVKTVSLELPVLKKGVKSPTVGVLQALLIGMGYDLGDTGADDSFGGKTDNAVRCFQEDAGLTVDGSVGRATWSKLLGL